MSTPIVVSIPHQLGAVEARRRIDEGLGRLTASLAPGPLSRVEQRWEGDRLNFSAQAVGQTISGRLEVMAQEVRMELDLPGVLGMIAGKISGRLRKEGQLLLEKK